ncbi:Coiled-coil domain-containing protein 63 [Coelomomyces lativittatus]|nr:Coiled-coil domain-containing protein 63 [Coelomomyces lativittatus]
MVDHSDFLNTSYFTWTFIAHKPTVGSSQDMLSESMSSYEKVLNHVQEVTGVRSLDELVQRFKDVEDHNFSLFNYVNQVNNEVEKVAEEIQSIQKHMSNIVKENNQAQVESAKKLGILENELKETQKETQAMSQKNEEIQKIMQTLYVGVQQLVEAFQTSHVSVTSTMPTPTDENGETTIAPVTPIVPPVTVNPLLIPPITQPAGSSIADALIMYLGIIEEKANELLILHQLTVNPRKLASAGAGPPSSVPNSASPNLDDREGTTHLLRSGPTHVVVTIQAPNTGDNDSSDEENEEEGPLSREELLAKSIKSLNKRMQNGGSSKKRRGRRLNEKKGSE